jgi:glycosyltransferase involved in cell wall biosynthesis
VTERTNVLWLIDHVCYDGTLHGGGRLFMNLAPRLQDRGVNIFPYFLRASDEVVEVFRDAPLQVTNLDKSKYDLSALFTLRKLCREHDIDVMHLFCYASSTFGRLVGRWLGLPTVVHDFDTQIYFPYPFYLKVADRMLANDTSLAFAASQMCRSYMADVRNVPAERIRLMYHAIPERRLKQAQAADRSVARTELGVDEDAPLFCCPTKLGPERGNDVLLDAFAKVVERVPNAQLAIVYKPTLYHVVPKEYEALPWIRDIDFMRRQIQDWVSERGLEANVKLVESLDDPSAYFEASDALVAPFMNERFSSVYLVEGLAYGLPIIAFDIGEPQEIVEEGGNGMLLPVGDVGALAEALVRLSTDREQLEMLREGARRSASRFTANASADRLIDTYRQLAQRHRATSTAEA